MCNGSSRRIRAYRRPIPGMAGNRYCTDCSGSENHIYINKSGNRRCSLRSIYSTISARHAFAGLTFAFQIGHSYEASSLRADRPGKTRRP